MRERVTMATPWGAQAIILDDSLPPRTMYFEAPIFPVARPRCPHESGYAVACRCSEPPTLATVKEKW